MSEGSFGLTVQLLPSANDRVLVVGQAAAVRSGEGRFSTSDAEELFDSLRVPRPANTSSCLGRLRSRGLVTRLRNADWALTPTGQQHAVQLVGDVDWQQIERELAGSPGAEFDRATHRLIPPTFAPPRWAAGIARLLDRYPFEQNVFCMTRFSEGDGAGNDPLATTVGAIREVLGEHGLVLHTADERQADDDLLGNVGAHLWACQYGIGLLEDFTDRGGLNHNVILELGSMIITGRRCAILRDLDAPELPTDLSGQIYKPVDLADTEKVTEVVSSWVTDDLGLQ